MRIIGFLLLSFVFSTEILISQVTFEAKLSKKKLGLNVWPQHMENQKI